MIRRSSVPCHGHDISISLVVGPGRECSPSVRPCRWPWPWWGRLQALRRGACFGLGQTQCDPTAPIHADHGDEVKRLGLSLDPVLGAAALGTVMPRRCSARLSGWGGTLCPGWVEQPFYGGKDAQSQGVLGPVPLPLKLGYPRHRFVLGGRTTPGDQLSRRR